MPNLKFTTKNLLLMPFMVLITMLFSCTQAETQTSAAEVNQKEAAEQSQLESTNQEQQISRSNEIKKHKTPISNPIFGKKTISFNGEKFEYQANLIQQGTKLFNFSMSEYGEVKGSFVVVTKPGKPLRVTPVVLKHEKKIAKDTYRIFPTKVDNLEAIYHLLKANEELTTVELEIDYSGKAKVAEF